MKTHKHILRLLLLIILAGMTMAPAMAQTNSVLAGQTTELAVAPVAGDTYVWELYENVNGLNFAVVPGNCPQTSADFVGSNMGASVFVKWFKTGTYFYKVTAYRDYGTFSCSINNLKIGKITVIESLPTAYFMDTSPICKGDTAYLSVMLTGTAPWSIDVSDGINTTTYNAITASPFILGVSPTTTTIYTVTRVSDANGVSLNVSNAVTVTVNPKPGSSHIYQYNPTSKKK